MLDSQIEASSEFYDQVSILICFSQQNMSFLEGKREKNNFLCIMHALFLTYNLILVFRLLKCDDHVDTWIVSSFSLLFYYFQDDGFAIDWLIFSRVFNLDN